MPTAAAIVGTSLIGAYASNKASSQAAKGQRRAIEAQNELIGPYSEAGQQALGGLQSFVDSGASQNFSDTQAFKDIINTQKARGQSLSGNTLTGLTDYYANNFRQQRMNELSFLPRLGANAAAGQATNVGNLQAGIGQSNAAGTLGMANSINSGIQGLSFLNLLNNQNPTGGT